MMNLKFRDQAVQELDEKIQSSQTSTNSITQAPPSPPPEGDSTFAPRSTIIEFNTPNKETLEAIAELESGSVMECENEEDFFRSLND